MCLSISSFKIVTCLLCLLLQGKVPIHSPVAECPSLQQICTCAIPQRWTWTLFKIQWTVTQNTLEMLLLVFHPYGCHLNASPNEPRPDMHQLHDPFWAAMHNIAGIICPTSTAVGEGERALCISPGSSPTNSPHLLPPNSHCGLQLCTPPSRHTSFSSRPPSHCPCPPSVRGKFPPFYLHLSISQNPSDFRTLPGTHL